MAFLYGAAVQGIQGFIFQSNKLREIVGASEMVAQICSRLFYESLYPEREFGTDEDMSEAMKSDNNFILHAAGNIKYIFGDKKDCEKLVKTFPKRVMEYAPGITLSQAVVEYDNNFAIAVSELEQQLAVQRNKPVRSMTLGLMGIARSRRTGLPVTEIGQDFLDEATFKKLQTSNLRSLFSRAVGGNVKDSQIAYDLKDLTKEENNWIAVIHADGNGLGSIVQRIGQDSQRFKSFSEELDARTVRAAQTAYKAIAAVPNEEIVPIRPVVLSGDDFTVICRADIAIEYTRKFLAEFEKQTKGLIAENEVFTQGSKRDCLTACAGIAFVKASYPFYYAYELAESLCAAAKTDAKDKPSIREGKELPQSCILFHKVQDSFNEDYKSIVDRELHPQHDLYFNFGPYYLYDKADRWTVEKLLNTEKQLTGEKGNAIKNSIREWLSSVYKGNGQETVLTRRIEQLHEGDEQLEIFKQVTTRNSLNKVPAYDILVLSSIR